MSLFRSRPAFLCCLLVYTLLLTGVLLYLRFPEETFRLFCQAKVEQLLPGTRCSIKELRYRFPLGMEIDGLRFSSSQQEGGREQVSIDQALIRPDLSALKSQFLVEVSACDGLHSFSLLVDRENQELAMEDIQLTNLNLAKVPFLQETFNREITGSLSGKGSYRRGWQKKGSPARGQGNMVITGGGFSLLFPIFSLEEIDLKRMTAELVLEKNSLIMNRGNFKGEELKGEFSGDLGLQSPLRQSQLAFKGKLEPLPALLKTSKYAQDVIRQLKKQRAQATIPFLLLGRVESPKFKIDS